MRIFNCLAYHCKIRKSLVANTFLGLSVYYTSEKTLKRVNIGALESYFLKIIFQNSKDEEVAESFTSFGIWIMMLTYIFDNYFN